MSKKELVKKLASQFKDYKQHQEHNIFTYTFKDYIAFCTIHNLKTSRYNNLILFKRYIMEG